MLTNIEGQISSGLLYMYMYGMRTCKKDTNKNNNNNNNRTTLAINKHHILQLKICLQMLSISCFM